MATAATRESGAASGVTNDASLPQLGALEEDDEFEEFAAEDWNEADEDHKDNELWEDDWDDDNVEDDFSVQLRAELEKQSTAMKT